jgi:type VI secretion system protein ImpF
MANRPPRDRLQPSLLDRLTDDEPGIQTEPRERRFLSMQRLRESLLRDLTWLMNADNMAQTQDLSEFPAVASSTLNYGVPDIAGVSISAAMVNNYEREVRRAILAFEPRILPQSLRVRGVVDSTRMDHRTLTLEIEGEMWADPVPLHVLLKTDVDIESGEATVRETAAARVP